MLDRLNRNIDYLRISVTDQCNLRCIYCMPEEASCSAVQYLSFDHIVRICEAAAELGVCKIKITGGEPFMRKDLQILIRRIYAVKGIHTVTLTTNGILLAEQCEDMKKAGVAGINVSFDSRNPERYKKITKRDRYHKAFEGLTAAVSSGIPTKVNSVIVRGVNEDEITELAAFAKDAPVDVRFIELMPVGCGQKYQGVSSHEIQEVIRKKYGDLTRNTAIHGNGPAVYYDVQGFQGSIGFISALTHEFCQHCSRIRLTCDGRLKLCLQYEDGINLKELLEHGITKQELKQKIVEALERKPFSHQFGTIVENGENRLMSEIGG